MPQNIGDNRIDESGIARISQEDANRLKRYLVRKGDIVYSRRGDVEKRALVRDAENGWLCGTGCLRVRLGDNGVDPRYASYFLGHPRVREWIVRHAHGATMPNLNTSILSACPFVTPPKREQRAIAHILGTLDDKIELNRRMNKTLEDMARTLFKSWFIDFDPVHAKAALKRHAANLAPLDWTVECARAYLDGMDPSITALFPDSFVDSELGEIPAGWGVGKFGDHISATRGLSYKGAGLCRGSEGLPMHNLNSIFEGGGYKNDGIKYYKGEYREKHLLKPGDLIVTNTEQGFDRLLIGYAAIVPERFGPVGLYSHHIYRIDTKSKSFLTPHYLVHLFNSSFYHHWISGFANGTTINMLPMDALEIPLLVVPPSELIRAFTILAQDIHAQFQSNLGQSRTLVALRDTLLPKLISGKVRILEAERLETPP